MIAVCLLTCDRLDYTLRTLSSFAEHNDLSQFALFHADDASNDPRVSVAAQSFGFRTVVQNRERKGWLLTRTALIKAAMKEHRWILNLENDIESLRPFPWALFHFIRKRRDVSSLRLYGRYKDRRKFDACLTFHKRTRLDVHWRPLRHAPEMSQIGWIHWSAQPSVTRSSALWNLHRHGEDLEGLTVRVKKNVMVHIGTERTIPRPDPVEVAC